MKTLRISATANGINYLPEYYARENGLFAQQDLDVTAEARNPWDGVMHDLADGPAMYSGRGREFVAFAQLNNRFPMAVVTREPVTDFDWSWLAGRTVLVPGQGGTAPYEFTAGLMRKAGVDITYVELPSNKGHMASHADSAMWAPILAAFMKGLCVRAPPPCCAGTSTTASTRRSARNRSIASPFRPRRRRP